MTDFDERIRAGLNGFPTDRPLPLSNIQQRARTVLRRRRAATTSVVLVAGVAVALPFAAYVNGPSVPDEQPAPAATASTENLGETMSCESWRASGHPLEIDEVPDHMRLLWSENVTQPPSRAWATDYSRMTITGRSPEGCVIRDDQTDSLVLVETDGDVITRQINIFRPAELPNATLDSLSDRTLPTTSGEMIVHNDDGRLTAAWPDDVGRHWILGVVGGMSDTELLELAEAIQLVDGEIDASRWSAYDGATAEVRTDDPLGDGIRVQMSGRVNLFVESHKSSVDLWRGATVDDEQVDINGRDGLLSAADGHIRFLTEDEALITITSRSLNTDELLDVARSIERVPADDPRLTAVWQTEFDQQTTD